MQWLWELPCTHPLCYPLYAACVELDVPVCLEELDALGLDPEARELFLGGNARRVFAL